MKSNRPVALVTGASRGIGRACAVELAKCGFNIAVNYVRDEAGAYETVNMVEAAEAKHEPFSAMYLRMKVPRSWFASLRTLWAPLRFWLEMQV